MAQFTSLPNDVLLQITSYFSADKSTLRVLALCTRPLSQLVHYYLVQNVDLCIRPHSGSPFSTFLRIVKSQPDLASAVRSLKLRAETNEQIRSQAKYWRIRDLATEILAILPNLQSLTLKTFGPGYNASTSPYSLMMNKIMESNRMPFLKELVIDDFEMPSKCLWNFMSSRSLRTIRVNAIDYTISSEITPREHRTSFISHLDINCHQMPDRLLHNLLSLPQNLRKLTCHFPGADRMPFLRDQPLNSPERLGFDHCLQPIHGSLSELHLAQGIGGRWPEALEARLSLRSFFSLKTLQAPSDFFFRSTGPGYTPREIHNRLPPSLVELKIEFSVNDFILFDEEEVVSYDGSQWPGMNTWRYQWMAELASHSAGLPALKRVELWELLQTWEMGYQWQLPKSLEETYAVHDIELEVWLKTKKH